MKSVLLFTALALACCNAYAQSAQALSTSQSSSAAMSGSNAAGGNANSNVAVYLGDPSGAPDAQANAQRGGSPTQHVKQDVKTVGNPGSVSYGVSFSQFNCANTAAAGVGWLGGVIQLGGGLESAPCNDRANASALFQIAGVLAPSNATLSSQLYHAAILLIGNSTKETRDALARAGVSDWVEAAVPPAATDASAISTPGFNAVYRH